MNVSGYSDMTKSQAVGSKAGNQSAQDNNSSSGWKYITVKEGDITYTYIVIGKNMKVLIGTSRSEEDKDKKDSKDAKTAGEQKDSADNSAQAETPTQNINNKKRPGQLDFLADFRMFGLTGYHQQKMRKTIKNMENHIVYDTIKPVAETANSEDKEP